MNFPEDIKYAPNHEWIRVTGDEALVGITDFAQSELGDIVFIDINTIGQTIEKDSVFGTIEAVKTVSDLFMPVRGTVKEKNMETDAHPELINHDPYGKGWLVKISSFDAAQLKGLLDAEQYRKLIGK